MKIVVQEYPSDDLEEPEDTELFRKLQSSDVEPVVGHSRNPFFASNSFAHETALKNS